MVRLQEIRLKTDIYESRNIKISQKMNKNNSNIDMADLYMI